MKEVRLKYNDTEELQYLIISAESYIAIRKLEKDKNIKLDDYKIFKLSDSKTGEKLNIKVWTDKRDIVVAEIQND